MLGKSWAAMVTVNLEELGVSTFSDVFDTQVCARCMFSTVLELCKIHVSM